MNSEKDSKSEYTYNNLIKNQETESMYKSSENNSNITDNSDDNLEHNYNVKYIVFSKWTWKSLILTVIAIIVLILLSFYIVKYHIISPLKNY